MKFADVLDGYNRTHESLPAWGVRVEMSSPVYPSLVTMVTPRMGSAG